MRALLLLLPLLLQQSTPLPGPGQAQGPAAPHGTSSRPNVLLILADDLGVEHVAFHPAGRRTGNPAPTPHLDQLASQAFVYTDFYATPICSASRATLLTGRLPFRHGVGGNPAQGEPVLPPYEITVAEQLAGSGYRTGAFGKWHISFDRDDPHVQGFEHYDGSLLNLSAGGGKGYYKWVRTRNGKSWTATRYATTVTTDAAVEWIRDRESHPAPWFAFVAYHAPHVPLEPPPAKLNPVTKAQAGDPALVIYHGMVEALDREIARLLREVDLAETLVIFVGDNGSPPAVVQGPVKKSKAKSTTYEGGIRVPAMIAGAGVSQPAGEYGGPVHIVDLFNTILDYTGTPRVLPWAAKTDSVSLHDPALAPDLHWLPIRQSLFSERFGPNGALAPQNYAFLWRSLRGPRYKLLRTLAGDEFYDLKKDPWENRDLLPGGLGPTLWLEYRTLETELDELLGQ